MSRTPWNPERARLLESCPNPECAHCEVGERLVRALNDARVSTATELLGLVRLIAATLVTTTEPEARTQAVAAIIEELQDDMTLLGMPGPKETH